VAQEWLIAFQQNNPKTKSKILKREARGNHLFSFPALIMRIELFQSKSLFS